jgi:hypothetical protein
MLQRWHDLVGEDTFDGIALGVDGKHNNLPGNHIALLLIEITRDNTIMKVNINLRQEPINILIHQVHTGIAQYLKDITSDTNHSAPPMKDIIGAIDGHVANENIFVGEELDQVLGSHQFAWQGLKAVLEVALLRFAELLDVQQDLLAELAGDAEDAGARREYTK